MGHVNYGMCQSCVPEQRSLDGLPATATGTAENSEEPNFELQQFLFPFGIWTLVLGICSLTWRWAKTIRQFRPSVACVFIGGLELWYHAQIYWFRCSFRWQAFGVLLLIYWVLGALWCTRDPCVKHPSRGNHGVDVASVP
jgi:hypothetical protein